MELMLLSVRKTRFGGMGTRTFNSNIIGCFAVDREFTYIFFDFWSGADGGKWMCPTARSRRDIHNEHVKIEKECKIGLETSKVRMSLRN